MGTGATPVVELSMAADSPQSVSLLMEERDRLFSYIWAIVGDVHLAEDVFQEVSLFVIEKRPNASDKVQFRVWLRRTARYKAIEAMRRLKKSPVCLDDAVIEKLEGHWVRYDTMPESKLVSILRECIRLLTPNGRKMITLRYVEGLRSGEIAKRLGRQVETVYQSIARAHQDLMNCVRTRLAAKTPTNRDD
jgi:RNA polymerase sigma-70 factor, ECF subfamily